MSRKKVERVKFSFRKLRRDIWFENLFSGVGWGYIKERGRGGDLYPPSNISPLIP